MAIGQQEVLISGRTLLTYSVFGGDREKKVLMPLETEDLLMGYFNK
jgi:hypothetical protein